MSNRWFAGLAALIMGISTVGCSAGSDNEDATEACDSFSACGGNPAGDWVVEGSCQTNDTTVEAIESEWPAACKGMVVELDKDFTGALSYKDGMEIAHLTYTTVQRSRFTEACFRAVVDDGSAVLNEDRCSGVLEVALGEARCSMQDQACTCVQETTQDLDWASGYTAKKGRLTYEDGSSAQFCVEGTRLTLAVPQTDSDSVLLLKARRE